VSDVYREAGVDIEAAAKAVALIGSLAAQTRRPEVADEVGGFAGLFRIGDDRLLAAATDGVGTKLEIARAVGRLDTVGIDLVAMCADDVVCSGAEPLFFLDYLAVGRVVPERVASIVEGVAEGCRRAGCALLGGETAEHPGVMPDDQFDLAGFCVGVVDEADLLGPARVREGDVLVGLASSGLHANGYSLVRTSLLGRYDLDVLALVREGLVRAAAHITGGGVHENVPRALPPGLGAEIERDTWPEHPIFDLLQSQTDASDEDMFSTFNMGLGMVLVVDPADADEVIERSEHAAFRIGDVVEGAGVRLV
jgi:phosphoribosylformylglycinamidine cyclo-ligase